MKGEGGSPSSFLLLKGDEKMSITTNIDTQSIVEIINPQIQQAINGIVNGEMLQQYTKESKQQLKKIGLDYYKTKFQNWQTQLAGTTSVNTYFNAYEDILKFRKFILGEAGKIDYILIFQNRTRGKNASVYINQIKLDSLAFAQLIKNNNFLFEHEDNIRISQSLITYLKKQIMYLTKERIAVEVKANANFTLINENVGARKTFTDGKLFKARIDALRSQKKRVQWYTFEIHEIVNKNKDGDKIFQYVVTGVNGRPFSSSVFSAIGKYFSDELTQKENVANEKGHSQLASITYPNAGNLTELYILAKQRLNAGKNKFPKRRGVAGNTLFQLYKEVKANTDAFYSGGDVLTNQIKGFLGSCPSLTSFTAIRNTVINLTNALSQNSTQDIKNQLSKLLLQKSFTKKISKEEQQLSQNIAKSFKEFFKDL